MLRDFLGGNSTVVRPNVSRLHLESAYSVCEEKPTSGAERRMSPCGVTDEHSTGQWRELRRPEFVLRMCVWGGGRYGGGCYSE